MLRRTLRQCCTATENFPETHDIKEFRTKLKSLYLSSMIFAQQDKEDKEGNTVGNETLNDGGAGGNKNRENTTRDEDLTVSDNDFVSSYVNCVVEIDTPLSKIEKIVSNWMFALDGDQLDDVYGTSEDEMGYKGFFESFFEQEYLFSSAIETFVKLLSIEEERISGGNPRRIFYSTATMSEDFLTDIKSSQANYEIFEHHLHNAMNNRENLYDLREIDVILVPMSKTKHFYVSVINLKYPGVFILDNTFDGESLVQKYGKLPFILKDFIQKYLKSVKHPKYNNIKKCSVKWIKLEWRTEQNGTDCGIFALRHMETYAGQKTKDYECGLVAESDEQQIQLDMLRKKYLCKMLLLPLNVFKFKVIEGVRRYLDLDEQVRNQLNDSTWIRKKDRLESFLM